MPKVTTLTTHPNVYLLEQIWSAPICMRDRSSTALLTHEQEIVYGKQVQATDGIDTDSRRI